MWHLPETQKEARQEPEAVPGVLQDLRLPEQARQEVHMNPGDPSQADICLASLVRRLGGHVVVTKEEFERLAIEARDLYATPTTRGDLLLNLKGSPILVASGPLPRAS